MKILAFLLVFIPAISIAQSEEWIAPESAKENINPVAVTTESVDSGFNLYTLNCKVCHGDMGENNPQKMEPEPPDLTTVLSQTDGELFYKITEGRGAMASYKNILSEEARWTIIAYMRSFDDNFKGQSASTEDVVNAKNMTLHVFTDDHKNIIAKVTADVDTAHNVPIAGIPLGIFVKRTFGDLRLSKNNQKTNAAGMLIVQFPDDLPGDSTGFVDVVIRTENAKKYPLEEKTEHLQWGTPTIPEDLLEERVMWGTRANAPLWIVFLYLGITGGVWLTIFYVIRLLVKIRKAGNTQ